MTTSIDRLIIGSILTVEAVAFYSAPYEAINRVGVIPGEPVDGPLSGLQLSRRGPQGGGDGGPLRPVDEVPAPADRTGPPPADVLRRRFPPPLAGPGLRRGEPRSSSRSWPRASWSIPSWPCPTTTSWVSAGPTSRRSTRPSSSSSTPLWPGPERSFGASRAWPWPRPSGWSPSLWSSGWPRYKVGRVRFGYVWRNGLAAALAALGLFTAGLAANAALGFGIWGAGALSALFASGAYFRLLDARKRPSSAGSCGSGAGPHRRNADDAVQDRLRRRDQGPAGRAPAAVAESSRPDEAPRRGRRRRRRAPRRRRSPSRRLRHPSCAASQATVASATRQRNLGIDAVGPDIDLIGFLDDDAVLDENAVEAMLRFFDEFGPELGGAAFNMINHPAMDLPELKSTPLVESLGLYARRGGAVTPSGFQTMIGAVEATTWTDWLRRAGRRSGGGRSSGPTASTSGTPATATSRTSISATGSAWFTGWPSSPPPATATCPRTAGGGSGTCSVCARSSTASTSCASVPTCPWPSAAPPCASG
ncbi:MAG: hypothetical protein MZU95_01515 [Desulfomicrobium escambiense]|nr:hypothetical protein [Desulfomicrobium escambiense]